MKNPKDLEGIDPCTLLSPDQVAEMGVGAGERGRSIWGEADCQWTGSLVYVALSPDTTLGEGLAAAYRQQQNFDTFAESRVGEYPAVRVNFATQGCGVIVGVSDTQTLHIDFTRVSTEAPGEGDPCGFAESVIGDVLDGVPDA